MKNRTGQRLIRCILGVMCATTITLLHTACSTKTPCSSDSCTDVESHAVIMKEKAAVKPVSSRRMEKVGHIRLDGSQVLASVISTGCTRAADFAIEEQVRDNRCYLQLIRTKPDYCRRAAFGIEIELTWVPSQACEGLPVEFVNPEVGMQNLSQKPAVRRQLKQP